LSSSFLLKIKPVGEEMGDAMGAEARLQADGHCGLLRKRQAQGRQRPVMLFHTEPCADSTDPS
jgi:hypothetical protein